MLIPRNLRIKKGMNNDKNGTRSAKTGEVILTIVKP